MDTCNWMSAVDDNMKLSALSIPGSHNTCALIDFPGLGDTARCQALSVTEQLSIGVRFMDIRCKNVKGQFEIYHGIVSQEKMFESILDDCLGFLAKYPSECIILSVKDEDSDPSTPEFREVFSRYVAGTEALWYFGNSIPVLSQVRGKLVLFSRFGGSRGILANPWRENDTFWIRNDLRVQDVYKVADKNAKWNSIATLYQELAAAVPDALYLNFTSGVTQECIPHISPVSSYIKPKLTLYLEGNGKQPLGITIIDYADATLCSLVLGANSALVPC